MRIALLTTCLVDAMFPSVGRCTVALLHRLGTRVEVPATQTCCGQMHVNSGYPRAALALVRTQLAAFAGCDVVVAPSGSCVASIRHQYRRLAEAYDERLVPDVDDLASRTYELTEFLVDVLDVTDVGARYASRVAYHPTCHSLRVLCIGGRPRRLLQNVRDLELVELPDAETCCGFGGTFALKNADTSTAMADDKIAAIRAVNADVVTAGDASCLMHIGGRLSRLGASVRAVHLAEILAAT